MFSFPSRYFSSVPLDGDCRSYLVSSVNLMYSHPVGSIGRLYDDDNNSNEDNTYDNNNNNEVRKATVFDRSDYSSGNFKTSSLP